MIRVLVTDDHTIVRNGICAILNQESDLRVVAEAGTGADAIHHWHEHRPDVTLMDLKLPDMSGVEAIARIRERAPDACIIILTTFDGEEDIYRGIKAGATSYLLKDVHAEELIHCVREAYAGRALVPPAIAVKLAQRLSTEDLTAREVEVLRHMAGGLANKEIGARLFISEGTVKAHVKSIFSKLRAVSRTEAIGIAVKRGIIRF